MSEALDTAADDDVVHHLAEPVDPMLSQWVRFRDQFAEAMGDGFWTVEDLEQKIAHKRAFFFPGKSAAIVSEISRYPGGELVMQFLWAVGDIAELVTMAPGIEAIARMQGCTSMLVEGRKAWERVLAPQGYKPWSITLHKAL